jgi:outer membrane protein TolC
MNRKLVAVALLFAFQNSWAMTLNEAIDTALKKSPLILIEKEKINQSIEEKRVKKAKNLGSINVVGSYTTYNIPRTLAPIVPPISPDIVTSKEIGTLGLKYDVMLFNGFSDLRSIEIAELSKKITKTDFALSKEQLIYNIKSIYFKILTLKKVRVSVLSYQKALEALYANIEKEYKLGKKAKLDLLKVASELENAKYNSYNIESSIKILKVKLASLIGIEEIDSVEDTYDEERVSDTVDPKNSLIYKKALLDRQKSKKAIAKAKALYYPKVAFNAYYGDNFAEGEKAELWQAGVSINIPLYDFGNRSAQFQKAKIAHMISEHKLQNSYLKLKSDIADVKERIALATAKIEALKKQLEFLTKIEETERIKYQNGVSDVYDLLLAISKKRKAESDLIGAVYDLTMQRAYLNYITVGEK